MRKVGTLLLAALVGSSVLIGACGDDDDKNETVSTSTTISPTQTSVEVGPNTTVTVLRPTTTGQ